MSFILVKFKTYRWLLRGEEEKREEEQDSLSKKSQYMKHNLKLG